MHSESPCPAEPPCPAERSEASRRPCSQTLRYAQGDPATQSCGTPLSCGTPCHAERSEASVSLQRALLVLV